MNSLSKRAIARLWVLKLSLLILCIATNVFLRAWAFNNTLPLWADSLGIMLATYCFGLWSGILVAIGTSFGAELFFGGIEFVYVIPAIVIAVIASFFIRRKTFSTLGDALGMTISLVAVEVLLCVPINFSFADGMTGSSWGDAVIMYLEEHNVPLIRNFIGQLYVEFLDKAITVAIFYALVHHFMCFRRLQSLYRQHQILLIPHFHLLDFRIGKRFNRKQETKTTAFLVLFLGTLVCGNPVFEARAGEAYSEAFALLQRELKEQNVLSMQQTIYDTSNGLTCGEANDLTTTPDGVIWVGTYAGLYRYTGKDFQIEPNFKHIRSVISVFADRMGRLWLGTNGQGVIICYRDNIISYITKTDGLPSNNIRRIGADGDDLIYANTSSGLVTIAEKTTYEVNPTELENTQIIEFDVSSNNYVGAVSNDGILHILLKGKVVQSFTPLNHRNRYTSVGFGSDNRLYACTADGKLQKFVFNGVQYVFEDEYQHEGISEVKRIRAFSSERGDVVFICADSGIFFLQDGMLQQLPAEDFSNSIENCIQDYQDNLWFASSRLGLLRLAQTPVSNLFQIAKLAPQVVNTVEKWQGLLYIGTDQGLVIIEPSSGQPITNNFSQLFANLRIRHVLRDSQGYLWVCTYGKGVFRLALDGSYRHYTAQDGLCGDKVRTVFEFSPNEIIVAGTRGYSVFDRQGNLTSPNKDLDNVPSILGLARDSEDRLYVCTNGQGIAVVKNHKIERFITSKDGLVSDVVMRMVPGSTQDLFYVVTGNGLCLIDPDGKVRPLDNFPYYDNFDVLPAQDGLLFITGSSGIYVINERALLQGSDPLPYVRLDNKSGVNGTLTSNAWNYYDEQHNLYLAGSNGVFRVNTYSYLQNTKPYRLSLREITLDQEVFRVGTGLPRQIARKVKRLSFQPEVVNYSAEDPQIGHYLEGLEQEYNYSRLSNVYDITYTNLPPGQYVLHVALFKEDSSTVLAEISYPFEKLSAFYDTTIFFVYLYTVAGMMIAYLTFFIVILWTRRKAEADRLLLEIAQQQIKMGDETILTIAQALDARDQRTQAHSKRVSEYSVLIARELGFNEKECENLRKVALLHDIGKIGIPDRILNKPSKLTDEEYAVMKSHVVIGADILKNFSSFSNVADGVRYHHERYDGKGYVQGLKGEEIPLYGRIIAVADTFDAMTANRVYRKKLDLDVVLAELERCKGTQFDPRCAEIMIMLVKTGKIKLNHSYTDGTNGEQGTPEHSTVSSTVAHGSQMA